MKTIEEYFTQARQLIQGIPEVYSEWYTEQIRPSPEVTSASDYAFLTRHYWKSAKPSSSWQESSGG